MEFKNGILKVDLTLSPEERLYKALYGQPTYDEYKGEEALIYLVNKINYLIERKVKYEQRNAPKIMIFNERRLILHCIEMYKKVSTYLSTNYSKLEATYKELNDKFIEEHKVNEDNNESNDR